jgi:hypothetical protein
MSKLIWTVALGMALLTVPLGSRAISAPVVVELFTSQSCSSCPPADALLGEFADEEQIIAIGYHVNYWDRLGWRDRFATRWGTERQYQYAAANDEHRVYTPQMIVDGETPVVGSDERQVRRLIATAHSVAKPATPSLRWKAPGVLRIELPESSGVAGAEIVLIRFDVRRTTHIVRGENGGKRLVYHHVARERLILGAYSGQARGMEVEVPPSDTEWGVAVLVQGSGPGRIWGAASLRAS